jgi:hypothetical protein
MELVGHPGVAEVPVESVEHSRDFEDFDRDACFAKAFRVGEVLVVKRSSVPTPIQAGGRPARSTVAIVISSYPKRGDA